MPTKTPLLNKSKVRDYALVVLAMERPHLANKLGRVSSEFFERMETQLKVSILNAVRCAPSVGKTLK
jgi:hypothetical protein